MNLERFVADSVLRIGEVSGVEGRRIHILVDRNKNLSDMFLYGEILRNIAVNGFVEIRKGLMSLIGRVEGELIEPEFESNEVDGARPRPSGRRVLTVSLVGYVGEDGMFAGGAKELPLIGNEAFVVTKRLLGRLYNLVRPGEPTISIATVFGDDVDIPLPIDGLFNSHIAIFGNTGSGKTNTLAFLYQEFIRALRERNLQAFNTAVRVVVLDFNGEYAIGRCITEHKAVYSLSTRHEDGDKLPVDEAALLTLDMVAILADATEKTQKPFLRRALRLYNKANTADHSLEYFRGMLRRLAHDVLLMSDKIRAQLLIDYFRELLLSPLDEPNAVDIDSDLEWHNQSQEFRNRTTGAFLRAQPARIVDTVLYQRAGAALFSQNVVGRLIQFLYAQLISDVLGNRAQNEHIAPVILRLRSKENDIGKLFDLNGDGNFWTSNVVVVNLHQVNLDMKKIVPLLLAKTLYDSHKRMLNPGTLSIVIDEAHNILSSESFREVESWRDYRLETFEEIIKEGRKFGVFITIASQRPNDISHTITSQAHNYFVHRLINQQDLQTIATAVSYIDRVTGESIPTLPTGTCVFSGIASQFPIKINVKPLPPDARPRSATRTFTQLIAPGV